MASCDIRPANLDEADKAKNFIQQVIATAALEGISSNEKLTGSWSPQDKAVLVSLSKSFNANEIQSLKKIIEKQSKVESVRSIVEVNK